MISHFAPTCPVLARRHSSPITTDTTGFDTTADNRPPTATTPAPQCRCALLPSVASLKPTAPCHLCSLRSPQVPASLRSRAFSLPDFSLATRYCPYAPLFVQFLRVTDRLTFSVRYLSTEKEAVNTESFPVGGTSIDSGFREELNLKRCRVSSSSPRFLVDFCKFLSGYVVIGYQINIHQPLK